MKGYGDNAKGWRYLLKYALTPTGGIVLCVISSLVAALILWHALHILGLVR